MESERRYLDCSIVDLIAAPGEKFFVYRTDILREYPFPELKRTAFIPEAQLLLRLPGKARMVNEVFRVYHHDEPDNLTHHKWRKAWRGMLFYYVWLLIHRPWFFWLSLKRKLS